MLLATSAQPLRDLVALTLLIAIPLYLAPALARRIGAALPFPAAPEPEPPLPLRAWLILGALAIAALLLWWPALAHDVEQSARWLLVTGSHGDEGRYKPVLADMFSRGTLDPHPKQVFFNYGHLHINLVMVPLLPLRALLSDPATTALLGARLLSFLALIAALAVGGAWCWRRWGPASALGFVLLLGTQPVVVRRALIGQTPDTLVLLTMLLAVLHAARFASQPNQRDILAATAWAGIVAGIKYVGLFFVPILVPLLLGVWRLHTGAWPRPALGLKVVLGCGLLFLLCFLACSPYHLFHPHAVAVMFVKAKHEYFPGAFLPGLSLRSLLAHSFLDIAFALVAALSVPLVLRSAWRSLRDPDRDRRARGDLVLLAWAALWTTYVSLFMHNAANTLPHLMFPALAVLLLPTARLASPPPSLPAAARPAWVGVFLALGVVLALLPATLPLPHQTVTIQGRQARLTEFYRWHQGPPRIDREPLEWFAGNRIPTQARVVVDSEIYLPERWPYFIHGTGPHSRRRLGLFMGIPEVLVTERAYGAPWRESVSDFPDAQAISTLYRALSADQALPYRRIASLKRFDVYAVPWLGGRELLDARATLAPPFQRVARRVRNPLWVGIERAAQAYRGPAGAAFPQSLELTLPRAGRPAWLVLLWDTRENMAGWFRDEAYATAFRLEASVEGAWTSVLSIAEHRPDAFGGLVVPLLDAPRSAGWRLVIEGWHGPGPVTIEHFALPTLPGG